MLFWHMTDFQHPPRNIRISRPFLQITYATPQWQVFIDAVLGARPAISARQTDRKGWDDPERAKMRIDLLIGVRASISERHKVEGQ